MEWIGVDLDGTLATYSGWKGADHIGEPIPKMVERIKAWRARGVCVKIYTARLIGHMNPGKTDGVVMDCLTPIQNWCREHLGEVLPVTNVEDAGMLQLWDDRAVQVEANTGEVTCPQKWLPT